ncbi:hypothetical protein RUND412_010153 [Rhizina undulata]
MRDATYTLSALRQKDAWRWSATRLPSVTGPSLKVAAHLYVAQRALWHINDKRSRLVIQCQSLSKFASLSSYQEWQQACVHVDDSQANWIHSCDAFLSCELVEGGHNTIHLRRHSQLDAVEPLTVNPSLSISGDNRAIRNADIAFSVASRQSLADSAKQQLENRSPLRSFEAELQTQSCRCRYY